MFRLERRERVVSSQRELIVPYVGVVTFFSEAGSYGCALLLNHGPLISNRFGGPDITDELLDCTGRMSVKECLVWYEMSWTYESSSLRSPGPQGRKADVMCSSRPEHRGWVCDSNRQRRSLFTMQVFSVLDIWNVEVCLLSSRASS